MKGPLPRFRVVLCTETDDYVCPEGVVLGSGRDFRFPARLASVECPAGVSVGTVYAVSEDEWTLVRLDYALLPPAWKAEVAAFREKEGRHYPGRKPWENNRDEEITP